MQLMATGFTLLFELSTLETLSVLSAERYAKVATRHK